VNWEKSRFTVHAVKTEREQGAGVRVVPIFPELYPHLLAAYDAAPEGAVSVIGGNRDTSANLRTRLTKIIRRAGLAPWSKLFQNLRSTRETELCESFPVHVVTKWLGNSPAVAARHYLQVTEEHYRKAAQKAAQNPAQQPSAEGRTGEQTKNPGLAEPAISGAFPNNSDTCEGVDMTPVTPPGFEPGLQA
jgi:hypothetical protein